MPLENVFDDNITYRLLIEILVPDLLSLGQKKVSTFDDDVTGELVFEQLMVLHCVPIDVMCSCTDGCAQSSLFFWSAPTALRLYNDDCIL